MARSDTKFVGTFILRGLITCETGLHIGGSKTRLEIGGVDNPVLRDPVNEYPFIAGSSLKGKMRSLLSFLHGEASLDLEKHDIKKQLMPNIFGSPADESSPFPTRLIVRDAYPTNETIEMWENLDSDLLFTEHKAENTVNRLTAKANPRFMERVVRGSEFEFELVFMMYSDHGQYYEGDKEKQYTKDSDYLPHLFEALRMVEANYIGGSGTRGYGKVSFSCLDPVVIGKEDYLNSEAFGKAKQTIKKEQCRPLNEVASEFNVDDLKLSFD